ncbi:MAG: hypothetical protein LBT51_01920 [Fusobacteriaceae bacterium]|jgi:AAA15 family ATPase/GTPase|nr:hypothetical protein [Fusobacteriaceae bacterium]
MKLSKISFVSIENNWYYSDLELGNINLIVGKNASGKTKTLDSLNNLINKMGIFVEG